MADDGGAEQLPESSVRGSVPGPKPAAERRARRAAVEQALILRERGWTGRIAREFQTSVRTVEQDGRHVKRRWLAEDKRASKARRSQAIRTYEALLRMAIKQAAVGDAVRVQARIDRITGLEQPDQDQGPIEIDLSE